jgi:peptidoglycan/xylan/chitin deacetylase (PgdA/CDA1 family)
VPAAETRVWNIEQAMTEDAPPRRPRSVNRRRVLFAAGGLVLLGVGGVATAAAAESHAKKSLGAAGGPAGRPLAGAPAGTSHSASATGSASASASSSRSASESASSSAGSPSSDSPSSPGSTSASPHNSSSSSSPSSSSSGSGGGKVASGPQWYVDDQGPMAIALTMDDGPHPVYTPQVLEIFRQYNIKATFNMIGEQVGSNLSLVREVSAEGHTITNHTWDHSDLSQCTYSQILSQIDRCNDALANANQHPTILRAPYGNWSHAVFEACAARNLRPVGWSVDPRDWDTSDVDTQEIVANVMAHTHAHDIILEHDGGGNRSNTVAALKIFIPQLLDKGFNFVAM